jgi:hypothetical protein
MRIARIVAPIVIALAVLAGVATALVLENQERLVGAVLASVRTRTGVDIAPRAARLRLGGHVHIVLDQPRISRDGHELARLESLTAIVTYHSLLFSAGLPLYALKLDHPAVTLPVTLAERETIAIPRPDAETMKAVLDALEALRRAAWRIEIVEGSADFADAKSAVKHFSLVAFRKRLHPGLWHVALDATIAHEPIAGARIAARIRMGEGGNLAQHEVAHGRCWFWNLPLDDPLAAGFEFTGDLQGSFGLAVSDDGSATGLGDLGLRRAEIMGSRLAKAIALGDYSLSAGFTVSAGRYSISGLTLKKVGQPVLSAESELRQPYGPEPELGLRLHSLELDAAWIKSELLAVRNLPAALVSALRNVSAGRVRVGEVSLGGALDDIRTQPLEAVRKKLVVSAQIAGAGFAFPAEMKIPPISDLNAQVHYAHGVLEVTQGSAQLGRSIIRDLNLHADLNSGIDGAPYQVALGADADLAELQPAIVRTFDQIAVPEHVQLNALAGRLGIDVQASGKLSRSAMASPANYVVKLEPEHSTVAMKDVPGPFDFGSGAVVIEGRQIKLDGVGLAVSGGEATVNGVIDLSRPDPILRGVSIDMHRIPAGPWVGLVVDTNDLDVQGMVGGRLTIDNDPKRPDRFVAEGKLTLASGQVMLGFLRSPISTEGATLTLHRRSLTFAMPSSKLEGDPLNFRLSVADIDNPVLRIDAVAQRLDFESLKFVRLPWTKSPPAHFFKTPTRGHVVVRRGNLSKLAMSNVSADFSYNAGNWRIYNMTAEALKGTAKMEITGRAPDDWIHITGSVADMDAGALFLLPGTLQRSPLLGHLYVGADLWADSNTDFFDTLSGKADITVRDGTLDRFTLFSRLLAMVDLKSWLTAQIPDPRVHGIPFKTLVADFSGSEGEFYTDNLLLQGPVMDISAEGTVRVSDAYIDMNVGMFPFETVNWLVNKIPLIGERVGSTGKLFAGYFEVSGPITDPSITPKPITSVAEFVKKTIGFPINLIRPKTIK